MTVLVCGSRDYANREAIRRELSQLPTGTRLVHGACPTGADAIADSVARELGLAPVLYPADWDQHGRSAGPRRNSLMLELERPELVLAFTENLEASRGTRDMVTKSRRAGVEVRVIAP